MLMFGKTIQLATLRNYVGHMVYLPNTDTNYGFLKTVDIRKNSIVLTTEGGQPWEIANTDISKVVKHTFPSNKVIIHHIEGWAWICLLSRYIG
jgi:hypothetical protein